MTLNINILCNNNLCNNYEKRLRQNHIYKMKNQITTY